MKINITNPKFDEFLNSNIDRNSLKFKYLVHFLDYLSAGLIKVDLDSFVIFDKNSWILVIYSDHQLFLYGHKWTDKLIQEVKANFDLSDLKNYDVFGSFYLVYRLIDEYNIKNYELIIDRNFYESEKINLFSEKNICVGSLEDIDELIEMFQLYYEEEYNGTRNKTKAELKDGIYKYIESKTLYIIKIDESIKAFCSINDPDIGIVFTYKDFRRMGFGKRLISYCSQLLLTKNEIVYTITDRNNKFSNSMCEKVGFEKIYEHTNLKINCG